MVYTIKEIAKLSGVSVGTVDRVLYNRGRVSAQTREKITSILENLNFQPNAMAKSLALRRHPATVGIVSHVQPNFSNYAIEQSELGIKAAISEIEGSGINFCHVYSRNFDINHQITLIDDLVKDGIVALMIQPISSEALLEKISSLEIPVFCYSNDIPNDYPHYFAGINTYKAGETVAGLFHLINPKLHKMAFISSSLSMLGNLRRSQGFKEKLKQLYGKDIIQCEITAINDDDIAYKNVYEMLRKNRDIDSLFLNSGAVKACFAAFTELGILGKIPIISFDLSETIINNIRNNNIAATIYQNSYQHSYLTVKRIYNYIVTGILPAQREIYVDFQIIIRQNLND
ncbi:MAG: LacI family transcriptional regulator [Treponema sp.]|nr:LacI family transcriptional regulator [Treponema sp.]